MTTTTGFAHFWSQGDAITRSVAALLLLMSISAWVVIFWKGWLLRRVHVDLQRAVPAFWAAPSLDDGRGQLAAFDRESVLGPLVDAALAAPPGGTLEARGHADSQLTRRLRDALHRVVGQLQFGQVLLASIGSTAPFIGLFGTVWGIYHALLSISAAGSITIERVSGPVGEALVMTAAGLAVAIPAVLAFNVFGKRVAASEAELEGFAHDLREMIVDMGGAPTLPAVAAPRGGAAGLGSGPAPGVDGAPTLPAVAAPRGGAAGLGSGPAPGRPG